MAGHDDLAPRVLIETEFGSIVIEIDLRSAPITGGNFLRYVDKGLYDRASFYRAVTPDGDPNPVPVTALQGGIYHATVAAEAMPPIAHEDTRATGLRHDAGTLSMARDEVGSADSEFFIVVEDSPELDAGGGRHPDRQGFAAFGRVLEGMDAVRAIHAQEQGSGGVQPQELLHAIPFKASRYRP